MYLGIVCVLCLAWLIFLAWRDKRIARALGEPLPKSGVRCESPRIVRGSGGRFERAP